jgi:hypothetical protein
MRQHSKNSITIATTPIATAMPTTIGIETLVDFLVPSDTEDGDDPVVVGVIGVAEVTMVAEVSVVVAATGGKSVGSRTVYLSSRNIIESISCHGQKRIASHESIYDDKWWASWRHGGDDSV